MMLPRMMYAALMLAAQSTCAADKVDSTEKEVESRRAEGPIGLQKFLQTHGEALARGDKDARAALDKICAQYDCNTSRLYWYTDLEAAKAKARAEHKPILSLRLLGRLDEELSCANSRFFRKLLYADARISAFLREHYVLHWKMVRPVPKVTIDFGDGRVLKRTVTGNSIHYVLDAEGRPIDAIPGLVAPKTFLASLSAAEDLAQKLARLSPAAREILFRQWHQGRVEQTLAAWESDIRRLDPQASLKEDSFHSRVSQLERASEDRWPFIAMLHRFDAAFAPEVEKQLIPSSPTAFEAGRLARTKAMPETPLLRQLRSLRESVAEDSTRNEYQLHRRIHEWLSNQQYTDVEKLNAQVYPQLFLMPLDDPWYGLRPSYAYSAIDDA